MKRLKRPNFEDVGESGYASPERVSQALGVGVSTVKRWVDEGIIPARVSPGGHRKLPLRDVLRLARDGKLPNCDLSILTADASQLDPPALLAELNRAIDADDTSGIVSLLAGAFQGGTGIAVLSDGVIAPAMRRLGQNWATGKMSVAREHRITQAFVEALYGINGRIPSDSRVRPLALGGAPESDHYLLPTLLAKMTLAEAGWNAVSIGPNTPFAALSTAVDDMKPTLVWITASHVPDTGRFATEYREFYARLESRGIAVAIGGQAFTAELRASLPYTTFGDGFGHLAAFARQLYARPTVPKRGRPPGRKPQPTG